MCSLAVLQSPYNLLLRRSGLEYERTGQFSFHTWGSYLVVVSPREKLYQNFYGTTAGNNGGDWLCHDRDSGDIMIFAVSHTSDIGLLSCLLSRVLSPVY